MSGESYGVFKSAAVDGVHDIHGGGERSYHTANRKTHRLLVVVKKVNWRTTPYSAGI